MASSRTKIRKGATIKDIAKTVNVSPATVSRVLNLDESLSVSQEVRRAILEAAEAMNYATPRQRQRKANAARAKRVGLLHSLRSEDEMRDPYYVGMRLGIERRCVELNLDPKLFSPDEFYADPNILSDMAGAILIGWYRDEYVLRAKQACENTIVADFASGVNNVDSVAIDWFHATRMVMNAVLDQGFERIGFLGWWGNRGEKNVEQAGRRVRTYCEMLKERGLFRPEYIQLGEKSEEGGHRMATTLLNLAEPPEAIITANDTLAVGTYRAIIESGRSIPGDISVASFNDISLAQFLAPPLTTLFIPASDIGKSAVDLLVERLEGRTLAKHLTFGTELIWRESLKADAK